MKLVVISDLHAHTWSAFARGDGSSNTRLLHGLRVLHESLARAGKEDCPWLFAGDVVHTAGFTLNTVLAGLTAVFDNHPKVRKVAIWGNHDARSGGGRLALHETVWAALLRSVDNLTVLEEGDDPIDLGGVTVAGAGYQPRLDLLDPHRWQPADVGLFHQTVGGSFTPSGHEFSEGVPAHSLTDLYEIPIVGHVHHPQKVTVPGTDRVVLVPGSPEHQNFGDAGDRGWWVLDFDTGGDHDLEFVPGGSPEFRTVDSLRDVSDDGHFYRVRHAVAGDELPENATAISPSVDRVVERDLLQDASQVEEVLSIWLRENPPQEPEGLEHSDNCALSLGGGCDCPALAVWDAGAYLTRGKELLAAQDPIRLRPYVLHSLRLENFACYESEEYVLQPGIWLVTGKARDYPSNGAGKTTLTGEALYWLLTGKTTKGQAADEVVRRGTAGCEVEAWIRLEGSPGGLQVRRSRSSSRHQLWVGEHDDFATGEAETVWEAASVLEMTDKLLRRLGISPKIIQTLGYYSQKDPFLFAEATDGERKSVIGDLVGLTAYEDAREQAAKEASALGDVVNRLRTVRGTREGDLSAAKKEASENRTELDTWAEAQELEVHAAKKRHAEAAAEVAESKALDARLLGIRERAERLMVSRAESIDAALTSRVEAAKQQAISEAAEQLAQKKEKLANLLAASADAFGNVVKARTFAEALPAAEERLRSAQSELTATRAKLMALASRFAKLKADARVLKANAHAAEQERETVAESILSGICPTCGQQLSAEHIEHAAQPAEKKAREAAQAWAAFQDELAPGEREDAALRAEYQDAENLAAKEEKIVALLRSARDQIREIDAASDLCETLEASVAKAAAVAEASVLRDAAREQREHERMVSERVERAARFVVREQEISDRALAEAERRILSVQARENPWEAALRGAKARVETLQEELSETAAKIEKSITDAAVFEYWKHGFSKQGLQSLLLEEIAAVFNRTRGEVFPLLTQGVYDVQFSTVSRTRSGEAREKTEFVVLRHGEPVPYTSLSGGEARRVDVGIMIALTAAVSRWMGVPGVLGVLTLDEVLSFTDASGAEGLVEALREIQETIPTIHVVTHDLALQSLFPNVLRVEQGEDGTSRIAR